MDIKRIFSFFVLIGVSGIFTKILASIFLLNLYLIQNDMAMGLVFLMIGIGGLYPQFKEYDYNLISLAHNTLKREYQSIPLLIIFSLVFLVVAIFSKEKLAMIIQSSSILSYSIIFFLYDRVF